MASTELTGYMKHTCTLLLFVILGILFTQAQLPTVNPLLCTYTVGDDFSYTQNGATLTFTNTTQWTGSGYTFATNWNFGDGGTATTTTTTHTYATPGTYNVRMVNRVNGLFPNTDYCYDTVIKQIIVATYPCSVNNADYTHTENHLTATFTNSSLENAQFTYSYLWRFGDGNTSTTRNPVYTYTADGTYTVRLIQTATNTVDNNVVCIDSQSYSITVKDWCAALNPQIQVNIQNGAYIRYKLNTASAGFTTLNATWNFGDPATLTDTASSVYVLPYAEYNYPANGTYTATVSLIAVRPGSSACTYNLTGQATITGYERCDSINATYTETIDNNNVIFINTSAPVSVQPTYYWDFGDGLIGRSRDTVHTYPFLSTYTVTYIISYPNYLHCADTVIKQITISSHGFPANQNGLTTINDGYLKYDSLGTALQQTAFPYTALPELAATYEFWYFNCDELIQNGKIFRTNRTAPYYGVGKVEDNSSFTDLNELTFFSDHPSAGQGGQQSLPNLHNNAWHHLAVEIYKIPNSQRCGGNSGDYGRANFYFDGVYGASSVSNNTCADLSILSLNIFPSMYMDEFVVTRGLKYNKNNFTPNKNNITTTDTNIVALYHFNADVDSVFTDRSVFFNSANNSFDMTSTSFSILNATGVRGEVARGTGKLIQTAHGRADKDSVCVGDTITFGDGYNVFLNPVQGLQQISPTQAIAITPDTTISIGAYFVDSFTCLQLFDTLQLYIYPLPVVSAGADTFVCYGDTVQLNATGGIIYLWNNSPSLSSTTIASPLAYPGSTSNFICTITDVNGCKAKDTVQVEVKALPAVFIDLQHTDTLLCNNQSALFALDSASSAAGSIAWNIPNATFNSVYSGTYYLDSSLLVIVTITDSNQCKNSDSVWVHALKSPTVVVALNDTSICQNKPLQLLATSNAQLNTWNGLPDSSTVYAISSTSYTLTGTNSYTFTYSPFNIACSLTDSFNLQVLDLPVISPLSDTTLCAGSSISLNIPGNNTVLWNNNYVNGQLITPALTTTFIATATDSNGCTSYDTVDVQIIQPLTDTLDIQICSGRSYFAAGAQQTISGYYSDTLVAQTGCDSIIVTHLQVVQAITNSRNVAICSGQTYFVAGGLQSQTGTYYDTLSAVGGCDSIIITQLLVRQPDSTQLTQAICQGASYNFNGQNITQPGIYTDTLTNQYGCDSLLLLTVTINNLPTITFNLPDSICSDTSALVLTASPAGGVFSGTAVTGNIFAPPSAPVGFNSITYSYTDTNNCSNNITDSLIVALCNTDTNCRAFYTLYKDTARAQHWFALNQSTGTGNIAYIWSWGDGNNSIGATPSHLYNAPGNYNICLTITDGAGCSDSYCDSSTYIYKTQEDMIAVDCVLELPTGIAEEENNSAISIYPNPASNILFIKTSGAPITEVNIYTTTGQKISSNTLNANLSFDVSKLSAGVYIAEIKTKTAATMKRWVKM